MMKDREAWRTAVYGVAKRKTQEMDFLHTEKREADGDGVLGPRKENSGLQGPC